MDIETDKREATVFASSLVQQVNTEDVANMVQVQRGMLQRFEKTNEMLINFNQLSFTRYEASVKDFQQHTQLLYDMKKDLDSIFKRIRVLKQRLSKSYPEAFAACSSVIMMGEDDQADEDVTSSTSTTTSTTTTTTQPATSQPASQPPHHASSSATKTSGDVDSSAGKIAQPQKPRSKSSKTPRKEDSGCSSGHRVRKTSQSMKETSSGRKSESKGSGSSSASGGQFQSKLI